MLESIDKALNICLDIAGETLSALLKSVILYCFLGLAINKSLALFINATSREAFLPLGPSSTG